MREEGEKETKCEHREKQSPLNSRIGMHLIGVGKVEGEGQQTLSADAMSSIWKINQNADSSGQTGVDRGTEDCLHKLSRVSSAQTGCQVRSVVNRIPLLRAY